MAVPEGGFGVTERFLVALGVPLVDLLGRTLAIREAGRVEWGPRARQAEAPIWALWHETILLSIWHHRFQDVHVLISKSRDGELVARLAAKFGYTALRGSTTRGGAEGARALVASLRAGKRCAITPDGPRGPRRRVQPGVAAVARLSGAPVVPFGFAARRAWRLSSWDRFLVPQPFTCCAFVYGEPLRLGRRGGDDEVFRARVQAELERTTEEAERIVGRDAASESESMRPAGAESTAESFREG